MSGEALKRYWILGEHHLLHWEDVSQDMYDDDDYTAVCKADAAAREIERLEREIAFGPQEAACDIDPKWRVLSSMGRGFVQHLAREIKRLEADNAALLGLEAQLDSMTAHRDTWRAQANENANKVERLTEDRTITVAERVAAVVIVKQCHDLIELNCPLEDMVVRGEQLLRLMKQFLADPRPAGKAMLDNIAKLEARLTRYREIIHAHEQTIEEFRAHGSILEARVREQEQEIEGHHKEHNRAILDMEGMKQERDRLAQRVKELESAAG